MNLLENHAQTFRRNLYNAIVLYTLVSLMSIGWGYTKLRSLTHNTLLLETQLHTQPSLPVNKEETQTMEDIKKQLSRLFTVPLSGISFSVLLLDEEGMRVRGNARTATSLDTWLGEVSQIFIVDAHSSQSKAERGIMFEVLLHEKP